MTAASLTCGMALTFAMSIPLGPPAPLDPTTVLGEPVATTNRSYALSVRRAAAAAAITTPPTKPTITPSVTTAPHPCRSSDRARIQIALISFCPQNGGGPKSPGDACGKRRDQVGEHDRRGDQEKREQCGRDR